MFVTAILSYVCFFFFWLNIMFSHLMIKLLSMYQTYIFYYNLDWRICRDYIAKLCISKASCHSLCLSSRQPRTKPTISSPPATYPHIIATETTCHLSSSLPEVRMSYRPVVSMRYTFLAPLPMHTLQLLSWIRIFFGERTLSILLHTLQQRKKLPTKKLNAS